MVLGYYFCLSNYQTNFMSEQKTSTAKYWLPAIISIGVTVGLLIVTPQFFWVTLPFAGAFTAKAMDVI